MKLIFEELISSKCVLPIFISGASKLVAQERFTVNFVLLCFGLKP
jgi:hypothetical protein